MSIPSLQSVLSQMAEEYDLRAALREAAPDLTAREMAVALEERSLAEACRSVAENLRASKDVEPPL